MKQFSILIQPIKKNVYFCVREYYENEDDVKH